MNSGVRELGSMYEFYRRRSEGSTEEDQRVNIPRSTLTSRRAPEYRGPPRTAQTPITSVNSFTAAADFLSAASSSEVSVI
jgi:hypothetical protein